MVESCPLVRAWRDLRALRDPDAWDAWIRRMTVNACYDVARKDQRRRSVEADGLETPILFPVIVASEARRIACAISRCLRWQSHISWPTLPVC